MILKKELVTFVPPLLLLYDAMVGYATLAYLVSIIVRYIFDMEAVISNIPYVYLANDSNSNCVRDLAAQIN